MLNEQKKDNIIYLVMYLHKLIDRDFDNKASNLGITGQQGRILFFIHICTKHKGIDVHQNDIENEFHLSKSTVSGLVKRMEKKGVISIEKQHTYANLRITEKGEEIICHLHQSRKDTIDQLTNGLDENDKKIACEYLVKLIKNMEGGTE